MQGNQEKKAFIQSASHRLPKLDLATNLDGSGFLDRAAQAMWELWLDRSALSAPAPATIPEEFTLVPKEPSDGLLMSMAMRWDHGLGVPGYYDQFIGLAGAGFTPTHAEKLNSTLESMRKLHEEVVGTGFHNPLDESFHLSVLSQSGAPKI